MIKTDKIKSYQRFEAYDNALAKWYQMSDKERFISLYSVSPSLAKDFKLTTFVYE